MVGRQTKRSGLRIAGQAASTETYGRCSCGASRCAGRSIRRCPAAVGRGVAPRGGEEEARRADGNGAARYPGWYRGGNRNRGRTGRRRGYPAPRDHEPARTNAVRRRYKLPPAVAEKLTPARAAQFERGVKEIRGDVAAEPARTVQARLDEWLGKQRALVLTGAMKPDRYDNVRICLSHFASFVGETSDVSCIDAERLDEFHNFALSKIHDGGQGDKGGWSVSYAK